MKELADRFCNQEVDADDFLSQYLPKRTVAHLRRIKTERLADMVRSGPIAGACQGASVTPNQRPYPDTNVTPPYPTSAFGMPQPNMYSS